MGGRREVSIISHTPVTRSDLKQEWSFFVGIVSTFLQLVVENPPHKQWLVICSNKGLLYLLTCGINRRLPYSKRILLQLRCYRLCRPNFDYGKLKIINTDLISPLFYQVEGNVSPRGRRHDTTTASCNENAISRGGLN